jgi:hypothetical protein
VSIEAGHENFEMKNNFLVDFKDHRLIRNFARTSTLEICCDIEVLGSSCCSHCESLSSISFESNSGLNRIESYAFYCSRLQRIEIPGSVEILRPLVFILVNHFHPFRLNQTLDRMILDQMHFKIHQFDQSTFRGIFSLSMAQYVRERNATLFQSKLVMRDLR